MDHETLDLAVGRTVVVLVAGEEETVFRRLLQPALLQQGFDLVLPEAPVDKQRIWLLLRRAGSNSDGDAADNFGGNLGSGTGLVVRAQRVDSSGRAHLLLRVPGNTGAPGSGSRPRSSGSKAEGWLGAFPWHPTCRKIPRLGCGVDRRACLEAFAAAAAARPSPSKVSPYPSLVPVCLHAAHEFLEAAAAAVRLHNQENPDAPVTPLLLNPTVQRNAAAVAIQSAWRAHLARSDAEIGLAALQRRAVIAIQHSWRTLLLRSRLAMLSQLAALAAAGRRGSSGDEKEEQPPTAAFALSLAGWRLVQQARRAAGRPGPWPEHRIRFLFAPGDRVVLVEGWDCQGDAIEQEKPVRPPLLPQWLMQGEVGGGSSGTAKLDSKGKGAQRLEPHQHHHHHRQPLQQHQQQQRHHHPEQKQQQEPLVRVISRAEAASILEESIFFEPFGREDAWRLLEQGCQAQDILPLPEGGGSEAAAVAAALAPDTTCRVVTFSNPREALARRLLLLALTWEPAEQAAAALKPVAPLPLPEASTQQRQQQQSVRRSGGSSSSNAGRLSVAAEGGGPRGAAAASVRGSTAAAAAAVRRGARARLSMATPVDKESPRIEAWGTFEENGKQPAAARAVAPAPQAGTSVPSGKGKAGKSVAERLGLRLPLPLPPAAPHKRAAGVLEAGNLSERSSGTGSGGRAAGGGAAESTAESESLVTAGRAQSVTPVSAGELLSSARKQRAEAERAEAAARGAAMRAEAAGIVEARRDAVAASRLAVGGGQRRGQVEEEERRRTEGEEDEGGSVSSADERASAEADAAAVAAEALARRRAAVKKAREGAVAAVALTRARTRAGALAARSHAAALARAAAGERESACAAGRRRATGARAAAQLIHARVARDRGPLGLAARFGARAVCQQERLGRQRVAAARSVVVCAKQEAVSVERAVRSEAAAAAAELRARAVETAAAAAAAQAVGAAARAAAVREAEAAEEATRRAAVCVMRERAQTALARAGPAGGGVNAFEFWKEGGASRTGLPVAIVSGGGGGGRED